MAGKVNIQKFLQSLQTLMVKTNLRQKKDHFYISEDRAKKTEKRLEDLERRMYNVEVKDQNCTCFCRKI